MAKFIEVKQLTKKYRDGKSEVVALDSVNFDLEQGDDLAIVGPSGSGKTTLIELMSGLNKPSSGEVTIGGQSVWAGNDNTVSGFRNQTMGFIFQLIHLQDYLSALENVMLPMLIAGKGTKMARERAEKLLTDVGLQERLHHNPSAMSGGEMQRVAVARALANSPKIIFADEPTGKLDKQNAENIINILTKIAKQEQMSVVMITHDQAIASKFNNILWLEHGKVQKAQLN
jgi:ABC-type lipoprotein export system ATPase subunit